MKKEIVLSTLLLSGTLVGVSSIEAKVNDDSSLLKQERMLISVEDSKVKLYKNAKLKEYQKVKRGTVYKVEGYRHINGKKYYRVYQENAHHQMIYRGYLLDKGTKEIKVKEIDKKYRFVGLTQNGQIAWKNLYFNHKLKTYHGLKQIHVFEAKHSYQIGGKTYVSLYRGKQWMGYMNQSALQVLTPKRIPAEKQNYKVAKGGKIYRNLYFMSKEKLKKEEAVKVSLVYSFANGQSYGSLYNAKGKWLGYMNMKHLKAENKGNDDFVTKDFILSVKSLAQEDSLFQKNAVFKKAVEELERVVKEEQSLTHHQVVTQAKKVSQMIMKRFDSLYHEVLPWNHHQEVVNPKVKITHFPSVVIEEPDIKHIVVSGEDLTPPQFYQWILKYAPRVKDYYTANSYDLFIQHLITAKQVLAANKAQASALLSTQSIQQMKSAIHKLLDAQQKLTFNRDKIISVLRDAKKARRIWVEKQNVLATGYEIKVKAQSSAVNKKLVALSAQLGYSLKQEKDQYQEGDKKKFFATKEQVAERLKATKKNAQFLAQLLFMAENNYYRYISTVKWSPEQHQFVSIVEKEEE